MLFKKDKNHPEVFCKKDVLKIFRKFTKKSHTCEEGGAHPKISVWHLLMNLRNNYLLKKTVEVKNKKKIKKKFEIEK